MNNEDVPGWAKAPPDTGYRHFSGTFISDCLKVGSELPRCERVPTGEPWCLACGSMVAEARRTSAA